MNFEKKLNHLDNPSELTLLINWTGFQHLKLMLIIILSALVTACAARPSVQIGDISDHMQVSVSPDGARLFLYWRDKDQPGKVRARLLNLVDNKTEFLRDLELPPDVVSTAYSYNNNEVLATTYKEGVGKLWRINITTQERELIIQSNSSLNFPAEQKPGRYVFLEANNLKQASYWQRFENGVKKQINDFPFRAASDLNILEDSLIIYTPANRFMLIDGRFPQLPEDVYQGNPFFVNCTQIDDVVCLKSYLGKFEKFYPSTLEVITNTKRCTVPGIWRDTRGVALSRNGAAIAFHAIKNHETSERGLYLIRFNQSACFVNEISIKGV